MTMDLGRYSQNYRYMSGIKVLFIDHKYVISLLNHPGSTRTISRVQLPNNTYQLAINILISK